jgi:hypothetical protein
MKRDAVEDNGGRNIEERGQRFDDIDAGGDTIDEEECGNAAVNAAGV